MGPRFLSPRQLRAQGVQTEPCPCRRCSPGWRADLFPKGPAHVSTGPACARGQWGGRRLRSWQVASPADLLRRPQEGVPAGRFGRRPSGVRREGSLVAVKTIIMKMSETQPALQDRFTRQVVFLFYYLARFSSAGRTLTRRHSGRTTGQWAPPVPGPDPCPPEASSPQTCRASGKAFLDSGNPGPAPGPHSSPPPESSSSRHLSHTCDIPSSVLRRSASNQEK